MIRILIADDDKVQLEQVKEEVCMWRDKTGTKAVIETFLSGQALVNHCFMSEEVVDIVLLDMQMDGMNGLDTGSKVRERYPYCVIVYVTNYLEYATGAFHVNAHRYVIKEKLHDELVEALNSAIAKFNESSKYFVYKKNKQEHSLLCSNILYFESLGREIQIHTFDGKCMRYYGKLSDVADRIDSNKFMRCHQSFIVNLDYVEEATVKKEIKLKNGKTIPISSKYVKDLKEAMVWREK